MTTETDIEEICRRLGWEYSIDPFERPVIRVPRREVYVDPENNGDLHMRWVEEHGVWAEPFNLFGARRWVGCYVIRHDRETVPMQPKYLEAIRAALIAKLRSEQDDPN
jgi:hypothetical protein